MLIIANADDFGHCKDTVAATIDCFERGALTSATIMVGMPSTDHALAFARTHPQFSFGVHLIYCDLERPVLPPADIPDLVTSEGRFPDSNVMRLRGLLRRVSVDQIAKETRAQLRRVAEAGIPISHVDSHGHLHKFQPFRQALIRVLPEFGIRRVRSVQDIYVRRPWRSPTYWFGKWWRCTIRARFLTTDHFFMPTGGQDRLAWPGELLDRIKGLTAEVGVHPGFTEPWRNSQRLAILRFAAGAQARGHTLISWAHLNHGAQGQRGNS